MKRPFSTKSNCTKMNIKGVLRSLITIPRSKMKIKNGRFNIAAILDRSQRFSGKLHKNEYKGGFQVTITIPKSKF